MSAPTFVDIGLPTSSSSTATVAWPAGHQADDIGVLVVQTANQSVSTPAGWTALANAGTGTAGAAGATALWVFYKRATSAAEADVSVTDPGDHFRARIMVFRGCETSGSPIDGSAVTGTVASAATAVSISMPTTTVDEAYVIALVGNATDVTNNQTTVGSWVNGDLTGFTRIINGNTNVGVGGGIDGGGGSKDVAGAIGATTSTLSTASAQALVSFALKPPASVTPTVDNGGIYVASGVKATAGVVSATTATMDTAGIQARLTIALKPPTAPPANQPPIVDPIPAIVGAVDALVQFPIVVNDPEDDALTLTLIDGDSPVPSGAEVLEDESSGLYSFQWTPTTIQSGGWDFFVQVSDGTNTVTSPISIVVQATADTNLKELAQSLASRAQTDVESARAVSSLLEDQEQLNAAVWTAVQSLIAELEASRDYFTGVIADLEDDSDPT